MNPFKDFKSFNDGNAGSIGLTGITAIAKPCVLEGWNIINTESVPDANDSKDAIINLYDKANPTPDDTPLMTLLCTANSTIVESKWDKSFNAVLGIRICRGLQDNDNTACPANTVKVQLFYS